MTATEPASAAVGPVRSGRARWFTRPPSAIPQLDGLRAVAILLVVARHGVAPFWTDGEFVPVGAWDLGVPLTNGWMGVDLFFVLSGFLITHHILRRYGTGFRRSQVPDYLRRRFYRIVPAYLATIAIIVFGVVPMYEFDREHLGVQVGYHLLFLQDYLPNSLAPVLWSLGVEEKFYLLAPLLMFGLVRTSSFRLKVVLLTGLALLPTLFRTLTTRGRTDLTDYEVFFPDLRSPFHLTFDGLILGVLAALLFHQRHRLPGLGRRATGIFVGGAVVFGAHLMLAPVLDDITRYDMTVQPFLISLGAAAMLLGLAMDGGPVRQLSGPQGLVVSRLSYAWYLVHVLWIPFCLALARDIVGSEGSGLDVAAMFVPIYVVVTLAFAALLHFAVERPFLARRDRSTSSIPPERAEVTRRER